MFTYWYKEVNKALNPDGTEVRLIEELTEDENHICFRVICGEKGKNTFMSKQIDTLMAAERKFYQKCQNGAIIRN